MKKINKIAIVYGGFSEEREVSLNSGKNCEKALQDLGYSTKLIDLTRDIEAFISTINSYQPDVVFNALHGKFGEDGAIQGLLNLLKLPYTHSGVLASSLAMDKERAKVIFSCAGIPVARAFYGSINELKNLDLPVGKWVLKPVCEGSSVGIKLISSTAEINPDEWSFGKAMLEEFIEGREITVGIMDNKVLGMLEITTNNRFYDYEAKYSTGGSAHIKVENIPENIKKNLENYALKAHQALGCNGISRADFRYNPDTKQIAILEVNTQPGMTVTSLIPDIAKLSGLSYQNIVKYMVESAICEL